MPVTRRLDGAPAGAPAASADPLASFVAANGAAAGVAGAPPANPLDAYLGGGALGALSGLPAVAGLNSFAATSRSRGAAGTSPVTTLTANGVSYACTPYEDPALAPAPAAAGAAASAAPAPVLARSGRRLTAAGSPGANPGAGSAATPASVGTGRLPLPRGAPPAGAPVNGPASAPAGGYGSAGARRPPLAYYNPKTGGVVITPPVELFTSFGKSMDKLLSGHTGNPFFDCVSTGASQTPFKDFVSIASKDAQVLSTHFKSYLQARAHPRLHAQPGLDAY